MTFFRPHLARRELAETRRQLIDATAQLEATRQEAEGAQAGARERQKKFAMLNATFRKKEEALLARCEDAESAVDRLRSEASAAEQRATLAQQVGLSSLRGRGNSQIQYLYYRHQLRPPQAQWSIELLCSKTETTQLLAD